MKKLGFGTMRLPKLSDRGADIDHRQVCRMFDAYLEHGFIYFDTAYMYHEGCSEKAVREDLVKRYDRQSFLLADKLPTMRLEKAEDMQRIFDEQRVKCGVDYFDYYLLHNLNVKFYETACKFNAFDFIRNKKEEGSARKIGFSFHATPELLDEILTKNPDMDFVQLQINYLDWESTSVQSRKCYEVARKHGKPIIIMEPVKGGTLARLPKDAEDIMKQYAPDASPASWAIRYAAGLEGVMMVLSGMSDYSQLCDNMSYMENFRCLDADEQEIIKRVRNIMYRTTSIPCTGCSYCTEGCPVGMPIPDFFALYNEFLSKDADTDTVKKKYAEKCVEAGVGASGCIACGQCESQCPQNLPVTELLKTVVGLEK